MHASVLAFVRSTVRPEDVLGKRVLEVGAFNVNGSVRQILEPMQPAEYIGIDIRDGKDVDEVLPAHTIVEHFGAESFDVVISTEMLEHAEDWRTAVSNMKRALRPGGLLFLTTRSPGFPRHDHPGDYWRFTLSDMLVIFDDMENLAVTSDPQAPGVFVRAARRESAEYTPPIAVEATP